MKSFAVNDRFKKKTQCLHSDKIWSPKKRHDFTMKTHTHTHTHLAKSPGTYPVQ